MTVLDHPLVDSEHPYKAANNETGQKVVELCREYSDKIALEWNGYCIDWIWNMFLGGDINKRTEKLAEMHDIPLVADTDLHGWNKSLMKDIGKSRIIIDSKDLDFNLNYLVPSIETAIKGRKYKNVKNYVSFIHFTKSFGIPIVRSKIQSALYPHVRGKMQW